MQNRFERIRHVLANPLFKLLVSLVIVSFFIYTIDINKLASTFRTFTWVSILVIILLSLLRNLVGSWRFKIILHKRKVSFFVIVKQYFIASFYNNILPTAIGGDAVRMAMMTKYDLKASEAIGLVTFERIVGLFAEVLLALICCHFWQAPKMVMYGLYGLFIALIGSFLFFKLIIRKRNLKIDSKLYVWIINVFECMIVNKRIFVKAVVLSLLYQVVSVFVTIYIAYAIGLNVDIFVFLTLLPLIWLFTMIPISFGGVGLREMSFIYLFNKVGYTNVESMTISLGTYFSLLISGLVGAVFIIVARLTKGNHQSESNE